MPAVIFREFSYAYKGQQKVLDNLNLTIAKGSFTVIAGPSGAGKTTLCLAICGVVPHFFGGAMAGEVVVAGTQVLGSNMGELSAIVGTVLEDYDSQLVTMTVEEEIAFALENRGLEYNLIKQTITETLIKVGLPGLEQREVSSLSGGQRQRLAIASVLAAKPEVLVLDEPASALDPEGAEDIYALLAELNRHAGITIVVVERDLSRILVHADQLVVLVAGKIIRQGRCEDVMPYLWNQEELQEMVPPLWVIKFNLEQSMATCFGAWRQESEAVEELAEHLADRSGEDCKSA